MDRKNICLEMSDLPTNIALMLERYLSVEYPNQDVTIHRGPLSICGHFPPEIQSKILSIKKENTPTSLGVTKAIKHYASKNFYETVCRKPITFSEIEREIKLSEEYDDLNPVIAIFDDTHELYMHAFSPIIEDNTVIIGPSMLCSNEDGELGISYEDLGKITKKKFKFEIDRGITTVDPFTQYRIRNMRIACIEYNNNYASEYLIDWYNNLVALNLDDGITYEILKNIAILNYIALTITPYVKSPDKYFGKTIYGIAGEFNKNNQEELISHLEYARTKIRAYIIQLTGTKVSEIYPYLLIL
jgi:hypothetical protein